MHLTAHPDKRERVYTGGTPTGVPDLLSMAKMFGAPAPRNAFFHATSICFRRLPL